MKRTIRHLIASEMIIALVFIGLLLYQGTQSQQEMSSLSILFAWIVAGSAAYVLLKSA